MKKILLSLIAVCISIMALADTWAGGNSVAIWTKGTGTSSDPFLIESGKNLAYLAKSVNNGTSYSGKYFKLTTDINLNNEEWIPIGNSESKIYSGVFDGDGHSITNVYVKERNISGLFGCTTDVTIKNLSVSGNVISEMYGAIIVGLHKDGLLTISNCNSSGKVSSPDDMTTSTSSSSYVQCIGGIVGAIKNLSGAVTITNCNNAATIKGYTIGGIVGYCGNKNGTDLSYTIKNCSNTGSITGYHVSLHNTTDTDCAGICGSYGGGGTLRISNSSNTGAVTGSKVSGISNGGSISQCYNKGAIVSNPPQGGDIACGIGGVSSQCYNSGDIKGYNAVGITYSGSCTNCFNTGNITATSTGSKSCAHGINYYGKATNCYSTGKLSRGESRRGIGGLNSTVTNCYYLSTDGSNGESGTPKTAEYMKSTTFPETLNSEVFQYDADNENNGYPIFKKNYTIKVVSNNTAMGTVSGGGSLAYGATTTIKATPKTGYHFVKWSDGNTTASRSVTCNGTATYTATFAIDTYVITVTSANTNMGTVTGGGTYEYNKSITINATPKTNYHFVKWSDGNTNASRSVTVTGNATYTATFAINTYALTVVSANSNIGTVTGSGTYEHNESVTITATPKEHCHFVKWDDGDMNATRTVTITAEATYTATFAIDTHELTVTSADEIMGTVTGSGTYDYNSSVTIKATPKTGYHFVKWDDDDTNASRSVTITGDVAYTATFEANSYDITVLSVDESTGTVSGSGSYKYATTQTISATPVEHYHFQKWNDGNTENPRSITIAGTATYTATFVLDTFALAITVNDATMGTTSGSGDYAYNSLAIAQATPNYGYVFKKWNDGNTDNPRSVVITQNTNYVANFVLDTFNITASSNDVEKGTVTGSGKYPYNTDAILSANAVQHYHFVKWNDNDVDNPRTITVTKDASYTAVFAIDTFAISAVANDSEMGTVTGSGNYIYGSEQDIDATANYGYVFKNWKDGETAAQRTITVTKNATYTAMFEKDIFTVSVSSTDESKGTVSAGGELEYLSEVQLVATPKEHYHFVQWSDGNTEVTRTIMVTKDLNLSAEFAIDTFELNIAESENGTVSGDGEYAYNSTATLTATPNEHYHFVQWSDGETINPREVTVTESATYKAEFAIDEFVVSLSADATMGTVQGADTYAYGQTITISAQPKYGYVFTQWSDGNTSESREIVVSENLQLEAQFEKAVFSVNIVSNDETKGSISVMGEPEYLSEIQLEATPKEHYHFVQWSDGDANATRTVVVTEDMNLTAEFAIDTFEVTIGECENGTITGSGEYAYNTEATLTAVPSEHYHFIKWGDGETVNPRQVTITENASFTAEFAIDTFTVALSTDATMGTVQGMGSYTYGATVDISAVPNYGYVFKQWSDGNVDATRSIVVSDNVQLEAQFENATFDVKIVSNDESKGTVSVVGEMVYESEIQLDAVAKEHYHFVKWSDGNVENPRNVTIKEDFNLTAEFAIDTFTVSVSVNKSEMGTIQGAGDYTYGQEATLVAEANEHYTFVKWDDGVTDEERVVTITDNTTYKAIFEKAVYNITAESLDETMGTVKILGDSFTYGDEVVLMATAKSGFHFVKWSDGNEEAARTVEVSGNKIFVAYFEANSTAIDDISNELLITIVNRQILVNGEAPAFVVTVSGQKIANANLKAGVYFVVVDGKTVGVSVQ